MEDAYEIYSPPGAESRFISFAVYDGHGGGEGGSCESHDKRFTENSS